MTNPHDASFLTAPAGVMDAGYAAARATKPALRFRLRTRAGVVVRAMRNFLPSLSKSAQRADQSHLRLLEVGAADCRTLIELHRRLGEGEYVGVEFDAGLIASRPPLPACVQIMQGNAESLPDALDDGSFDVVSMLALLEHLNDPRTALREAFRVVRPGGIVVATCPNPFWDGIAGRLGLVDECHHVERIDVFRLRELLMQAGFDVLAARGFMWAPIASLPYARIPIPPTVALHVDMIAGAIPGVRALCVNAYAIGRRPT